MHSNSTATALRDHGRNQEWGRKARKAESRSKKSTIRRRAIADARRND